MKAVTIDPRSVRDLSTDLLDGQGNLKVVPASYFRSTTIYERALFGNRNALYGFLTEELIVWLKDFIGDRKAIEIGSGHGGLARALGITATDNRMQEDPGVRAYYSMNGQPLIRYGQNVKKFDAVEAVRKFEPQVVVASWVTHKFDENRAHAEGNMFGVVEEDIIAGCDAYVFIGNRQVHSNKSIWSLPHTIIEPDWLFSRAHNGSPDFIAVWQNMARAKEG